MLSTHVCICVTGHWVRERPGITVGPTPGGFPGRVQPGPRVTLVWVLCYHVWLRALGGKGPAASGGCRTLEAGEQLSAEAEAGSTLVL